MIRSLALLVLCSVLWSGNFALASAEEITGAWSFRTDVEPKGCTITGKMTISGASETGERSCRFVSSETCSFDLDALWRVEQSCQITSQKDHYIVRSEVIGSLIDGYSIANYLPDNFVLQPDAPGHMSGFWQDRNYSAPVSFWRDDGLPVS